MPREATEDEVRGYLRETHPEQAELALWVRDVVLRADPELSERVYRGWQGIGYHHPEAGYVCAIFPAAAGLRLGFEHGASLPDPDGRLRGEGSQVRYLPIAAPDDALAGFVHEAIVRRLLSG